MHNLYHWEMTTNGTVIMTDSGNGTMKLSKNMGMFLNTQTLHYPVLPVLGVNIRQRWIP